jgi:hypothetical protein
MHDFWLVMPGLAAGLPLQPGFVGRSIFMVEEHPTTFFLLLVRELNDADEAFIFISPRYSLSLCFYLRLRGYFIFVCRRRDRCIERISVRHWRTKYAFAKANLTVDAI